MRVPMLRHLKPDLLGVPDPQHPGMKLLQEEPIVREVELMRACQAGVTDG
jgi:hypothetical protein